MLHLRNQSGPDERLYALTAAFAATALTVVAAGYLASLDVATADAVTVGAAAVAVAALARALPLPPFVSPARRAARRRRSGRRGGQLTALGGAARLDGPAAAGGLLGLVAGGCALIGLRVASYDYPSRFVHMTAGVALPLTLAAPAVYLLGRAVRLTDARVRLAAGPDAVASGRQPVPRGPARAGTRPAGSRRRSMGEIADARTTQRARRPLRPRVCCSSPPTGSRSTLAEDEAAERIKSAQGVAVRRPRPRSTSRASPS